MKTLAASPLFLLIVVFWSMSKADEPTPHISSAKPPTLIVDRVVGDEYKIGNLDFFLESFAKNHGNRLPSTWNELNAYAPLDTLGGTLISKDYALILHAPVTSLLDGDGQIIVIGRGPKSQADESEVGRFIVFRTKNVKIVSSWYSEDKVLKILSETHIVVTPPAVVQPASPSSNPSTPLTAASQPQQSGASPNQANPSQPAVPNPSPPASTPQAPSPAETGNPWWLYAFIVLSFSLIGALWYFLKIRK